MPAEVPPASRSARSPPACSPVSCRGCSRIWLWYSVRLRLPRTCLSGRTATDRIPHRTDLSSVAANARTDPAYAPAPDPDTGTAGLSQQPQNPAPAERPWRCDRTNAGAPETRCPDRSADSPPAAPAPAATLRLLVLAAASPTRTDPAATAATVRIPTSSCHTAALAPASSR